MAIHITNLNGGNITVGSSGGGGSTSHAETIFTFTGNRTASKNISGTLDDSIWSDDNLIYDGSDTLSRDDLVSVDIGNTVTGIGTPAFQMLGNLTSVTIPDSVTSIGSSAFSGCSGLESVTVGSGVTSIGDYAFYSCSSLASVTIGSGVTSIGEYAFNECYGLRSVTIDKTKSQVESMANKYWGLGVATDYETVSEVTFQVTIHCNDNQDIVINPES